MNMHDILLDVGRAKIKSDKIRRLRDHDSPELRSLIKSSYDPKIEWFIPKGEVPYTPNTDESGHIKLMSKIPQIEKLVYNHITKVGSDGDKGKIEKEKMFINILESLDPNEAEVLIAAKDKIIHRKYVISDNVVREAFKWSNEYVRKE
tara:strand:+ start:803 stop:1246 length:444 start_codon:yes stop_codon:yes gene_type:complete